LLLSVDVRHRAKPFDDLTVFIAQRARTRHEPAVHADAAAEPGLKLVYRSRFAGVLPSTFCALAFFRMDYQRPTVFSHVLDTQARVIEKTGTYVIARAIRRGGEQVVWNCLNYGLEALLAIAKVRLDACTVSDIHQ